jgi:hypothetical protein
MDVVSFVGPELVRDQSLRLLDTIGFSTISNKRYLIPIKGA